MQDIKKYLALAWAIAILIGYLVWALQRIILASGYG